MHRRVPVGAETVPGGTHFRVWAPDHDSVEVVLERGTATKLRRESDGYFSGLLEAEAGARYRYRLKTGCFPDPASRFQPEGPHGPSEIVDAAGFPWTDAEWRGVPPEGQVIYELHVGTFTPEGTWEGAASKLEWLRDTGITAIEVMPVNDFSGRYGWGYDGVGWFAPVRIYGTPDEFRRFVDRAHALGIGVILDVVYNHFGPDGNYLGQFAKAYFNEGRTTEWGRAINYDGEDCGPVREFATSNAAYWISEFHLDGLRLDATQSIHDNSREHIIAAIGRSARRAAGDRSIILVAENEPQKVRLVRSPKKGGYGLDMLWNDDFHHSAMVALTGHNEAYYSDYLGTPQEFVSAAKYGYLYQGQWYTWQDGRRGTSSRGVPPHAFVTFTQNHDQIANSASAKRCRLLADAGTVRALTALAVLMPGTPMLFQGQEFGATTPFYYFADHGGELADQVHRGRTEFMLQFASLATPEMQGCLPNPAASQTFDRSKLDWSEVERNQDWVEFHRDLIRLRLDDPTLLAPRSGSVDGAVLGAQAFVLRWFGDEPENDRLLVVNLGRDLVFSPAPEPLLAPLENRQWDLAWSTEDPRYSGCGVLPLDTPENWRIPGHAAALLKPGAMTFPRSGGHPREKAVRERNLRFYEQKVAGGERHG